MIGAARQPAEGLLSPGCSAGFTVPGAAACAPAQRASSDAPPLPPAAAPVLQALPGARATAARVHEAGLQLVLYTFRNEAKRPDGTGYLAANYGADPRRELALWFEGRSRLHVCMYVVCEGRGAPPTPPLASSPARPPALSAPVQTSARMPPSPTTCTRWRRSWARALLMEACRSTDGRSTPRRRPHAPLDTALRTHPLLSPSLKRES